MKRQLVFKSALLVLLLVMTGQFISAQSFTKQFRNEPLTGVIKELERQTGYSFIYETGIFRDAPAVTADFNSASVQTVLRQILKPPFKWRFGSRTLRLESPPTLMATINFHSKGITDTSAYPAWAMCNRKSR